MLVDRQIVIAHQVQPLDHVLAAVAASYARRVADAQVNFAAGEMQVFRDLAARLPAADHEHRALRKLLRVAIERRMDLHDVGRQTLRATRDDRNLIAAGRNHHLFGEMDAVGRIKHEAMLRVAAQMPHRDAFAQRRAERADEIVHVGDNLIAQHEAVRVRTAIRKARQLALPVWRNETERVPTFGAPGVTGTLLFEHNMIDAALGQIPADRKPRLAAADHGDRMPCNGSYRVHASKASTVTRACGRSANIFAAVSIRAS